MPESSRKGIVIELNKIEKKAKRRFLRHIDRKIARARIENMIDDPLEIKLGIDDFSKINMISSCDRVMAYLARSKSFVEKYNIINIRYIGAKDYLILIERDEIDEILGYGISGCEICLEVNA